MKFIIRWVIPSLIVTAGCALGEFSFRQSFGITLIVTGLYINYCELGIT